MSIQDLINNVKSGDVQSSNNSFNSIMADKINAALDTQKQDVASRLFGSDTEVESEVEADVEAGETETDEIV
jgi:uncharacterized membrane-anchored protein